MWRSRLSRRGPETTSEGLFPLPSAEDRLVHELARFSHEVIDSGSDDAVRELPALPHRLALQGVEPSAPQLVHQALQLWAVQVSAARASARAEIREQGSEGVSELARSLVQQLSWRLEDEHLDSDERFATQPFLERLFRFEHELLKPHAEADDFDGRRLMRAEWTEFLPGRNYDPAC